MLVQKCTIFVYVFVILILPEIAQKFAQLYTIQIYKHDIYVPVIIHFLEDKHMLIHTAMWEALPNVCTQVFNMKLII